MSAPHQSAHLSGHVAVRPLSTDAVFLSKDVFLESPDAQTAAQQTDNEAVPALPVVSLQVEAKHDEGDSHRVSSATSHVMGIAVTVRSDPSVASPLASGAPLSSGTVAYLDKARTTQPQDQPIAISSPVCAIPIDGCHFLLSLPCPTATTATTTTTAFSSSTRHMGQPQNDSSHVVVAGLLSPVDHTSDAAAPSAGPSCRVVAQLPFQSFAGIVRDYTHATVRFNEAVLAAAWEEKVGWRATSPLVVSDQEEEEAFARGHDVAGDYHAHRLTSVSSSHSSSSGRGGGDVPDDVVAAEEEDPARCRQILWEEEQAMEAHYQGRLRHRFLVSDPEQSHAIWCLEVHVPSWETTVVSPRAFFHASVAGTTHGRRSGDRRDEGSVATTVNTTNAAAQARESTSLASTTAVDPLASLFSSVARTEGSPDVCEGARLGHAQPSTAATTATVTTVPDVVEVRAGSTTASRHEDGEHVEDETAHGVARPSAARAESPSVPRNASASTNAPAPSARGASGSVPTTAPDGDSTTTDTTATIAAAAATAGTTPPTREQTRTRASSSVASAAAAAHMLAKHTCAPLMGGAKGFVDGHMSIARFNRPTALCWRTENPCGNMTRRQQQQQQKPVVTQPAPPSGSLLDALFTSPTTRDSSIEASNHNIDNTSNGGGDTIVSALFPSRVTGAEHTTSATAGADGLGPGFCEMLFISDSGNHAIRYANFRNRIVRTVAGLSGVPGYRDGSCTSSLLSHATSMAWCSSGLVFTDGPNGVVRLITGIAPHTTSSAALATTTTATTSAADAKQIRTATTQGTVEDDKAITVELSPQAGGAPSAAQSPLQPPPKTESEAAHASREEEAAKSESTPTRAKAVDSLDGSTTPVRPPIGLPPRSPRTPSPSPSSASKPQQQQAPQQPLKNGRRLRSSETREAALRRPRVWTVAGAPPTTSQPQHQRPQSPRRDALHHIDAQLPQRASFGFPANVALWPDDVDASAARVLIADEAFSAVRVLDGDGVRTVVSPLDYPPDDEKEEEDEQEAAVVAADALVPAGLRRTGCVVPLAFIQERMPWAGFTGDTPEPYLHTSQMVMLVCSSTTNAVSLLCPTNARFLERLALDVHAEVVKSAAGIEQEEETVQPSADAEKRERLFRRVAERVEEEEQRLVEIGVTSSGRRTVGELGLPSLRRLVLPMVDDVIASGRPSGILAALAQGKEEDGDGEEPVDESLIANLARHVAQQRAREQYLRLRFPFVMPPALVVTDHRSFPHLYCYMSGSRGRAHVIATDVTHTWATKPVSASLGPHNSNINNNGVSNVYVSAQSELVAREVLSPTAAEDLLFRHTTRMTTTTTAAANSAALKQHKQGITADPFASCLETDSEDDVDNNNDSCDDHVDIDAWRAKARAEESPPRGRNTAGPAENGNAGLADWSPSADASFASNDADAEDQQRGDYDRDADESDSFGAVSRTSLSHSGSDARDSDADDEDEEGARTPVDLELFRHARGAGNVGGASRYVLDAYATSGFDKLTEKERLERAALIEAEARLHWFQRAAAVPVRHRRCPPRQGKMPERLGHAVHAAAGDVIDEASCDAACSVSSSQAARRHARAARKATARDGHRVQTTRARTMGTRSHNNNKNKNWSSPRTASAPAPTPAVTTTGNPGETKAASRVGKKTNKGSGNASAAAKQTSHAETKKNSPSVGVVVARSDDDEEDTPISSAPPLPEPAVTAAAAYDRAVASLYDLFRFFADRRVVYRAPSTTSAATANTTAVADHGPGSEAADVEPSLSARRHAPAPSTRASQLRGGVVAARPVEAPSGLVATPRVRTPAAAAPRVVQAGDRSVVSASSTKPLSAPSLLQPTTAYAVSLTAFWRLLFHLGYLAAPCDLAQTGRVCDVTLSAAMDPSPPSTSPAPEKSALGGVPLDPLNTSLPSFTVGFDLSQEAREPPKTHGVTLVGPVVAGSLKTSARVTARRGGGFGRPPQLLSSPSSSPTQPAGNVVLPLSMQDWRSIVECLYARAPRSDAGTTASPLSTQTGKREGLDFAAFRRVVLLLWVWESTVTTHAQLQQSLQVVASAFADRRRDTSLAVPEPEHNNTTDHGDAEAGQRGQSTAAAAAAAADVTRLRGTAIQFTRDASAARFGWIDLLPLLDSLTEAQVKEAYEETFQRAVRRVPGFLATLQRTSTTRAAAAPSVPKIDSTGADDASASASVFSASSRGGGGGGGGGGGAPADASDALAGISPIVKAQVNDDTSAHPPPQLSTPPLSSPRALSVVKVAYPPTVTAADDLLRLLSLNEKSLQSLFNAYSEAALVRRSAAYVAPHAVQRCALTTSKASAQGRSPRRAADETKADACGEQDVLWKIGDLLSTTRDEQRASAQRRRNQNLDIRGVPFLSFRSLLQTLDVFPSLMNRTLVEVAYMDALSRPLWVSSSASLYSRAATLRSERARRGAGDAAGQDQTIGATSKAEEAHFIEAYTRDHSALTFLAFVEAFARVGLTVFSQLGEADVAAYPSAVSKVTALMEWVNRQVTMGHVERTTRSVTRDDVAQFPRDFPLFRFPK